MRNYKETEKMGVVFPFVDGLMYPLRKIYANFYDFLRLISFVALINTFVAMVLGRSFICGIGVSGFGIVCTNNAVVILCSLLVVLFMVSYFINRWYLISEEGKSFSEVVKIKPNNKDFKTMGFILSYFGLIAFACRLVYVLNKRVATPSFGFELMLFVALSLLIIVTVVMLLNFAVMVRFLEGKKWLVADTIIPIFDNIYKIVCWFMSYLLFFVYLLQVVMKNFIVKSESVYLFVNTFCGEFFLQVIILLCAACFISSLCFQAKHIFTKD